MLSRLGPLQGLNNLKIPSPFYFYCCKSCTHTRQSLLVEAVSNRLEARSEAHSALSLKLSKTIHLISLTLFKTVLQS